MAAQDDENEYGDDDLNQLPQSTLQSIEQNALSSTQQQVAANRQRQYAQVIRPFKPPTPAAGWQNPASASVSASRSLSRSTSAAAPVAAPAPVSVARAPSPASSDYDYGFDNDEIVIDLDDPSMGVQPTPAAHRPANPNRVASNAAPSTFTNHASVALPTNTLQDHVENGFSTAANHGQGARDVETQLRKLQLALENAQAVNQRQAGQIAIVRAKQEKEAKDHQNKLALIQKTHAEEVAKHKADVQAKKKEIETFETNNRFLEHDLAQARDERPKRLKSNGAAKGTLTKSTSNHGPQSSQALPYRDGFDDHEIVLVSPSKPKARSKPSTPKVGEKRKRNVETSTPPQLQLDVPQPASPLSVNTADLIAAKEAMAHRGDTQILHFQMIQRLMNHRPLDSELRVLEALSSLSFPSSPDQSIAGLWSQGLAMFTGFNQDENFPSYSCNLLLDLWAKCLTEQFYDPLYLLLDMFEFILAMSPGSPDLSLVNRFVPLATSTIDLIAIPRVRLVPASEMNASHLEHIDVDQILSILHAMALDASLKAEAGQAFWQKMEFDFTLVMLNKHQPLPQIILVLQIVGSSVMVDTFGVISEAPEKQAQAEVHTVDRLTTLLFERPEAPSGEEPYDDTEIVSLQIETVRVLFALASTRHGGQVLAQHRTALGRLVRLLHVQISNLYDLPSTSIGIMNDGAVKCAESSTIHELTVRLINLTIRLIYHLLINFADLINIHNKLMVIPGGPHKFLVALTRLAFSEQLVYEAGIEEEAVDAAHEILDGMLSPEEGEALAQAIKTPRGTHASAPG